MIRVLQDSESAMTKTSRLLVYPFEVHGLSCVLPIALLVNKARLVTAPTVCYLRPVFASAIFRALYINRDFSRNSFF